MQINGRDCVRPNMAQAGAQIPGPGPGCGLGAGRSKRAAKLGQAQTESERAGRFA